MGTLYDELQKWLRSPHARGKQKVQPSQQWRQQFKILPKEVEADRPVVRTGQSARSTIPEGVQLAHEFGQGTGAFKVPYLTGQYALDTALLANIPVQSLAYQTGKSPFLNPFALRFSPNEAYIDLGRLNVWDQWKILWTRVGAHYYQDLIS